MEILIDSLCNHPEHIQTVVEWLYSEWGNNNYMYWTSWVSNSMNINDVPHTFIVFVNGKIAGTYSLWRCDLQSRQDLFPWFGGLFVDPFYRGKEYNGIKLGVLLQNHAIETLKKLKYEKVYLFTEKDPTYYLSNGWKFFDYVPNENDTIVTICEYDIQ